MYSIRYRSSAIGAQEEGDELLMVGMSGKALLRGGRWDGPSRMDKTLVFPTDIMRS